MKHFFVIFLIFATVSAFADFNKWEPQHAGELRGPCPALNALANHGFIPRNGRDLTVPILVKGMGEGLNVTAETATALSLTGMTTSKDPTSAKFDLDDLNTHNKVEHDGSLSRRDVDNGGESQAFCPEIFNETVSFYKGANQVGIPEVAAARWGRIQSSKDNNPKFLYGPGQYFGATSSRQHIFSFSRIRRR
ncbi:Cloroperoxidase [Ophiobolus disseminans]|uniref:Cloroperoxidase n=1 Tax=Ophiobolus disseminans TaxID=1469910 RepID=A0A6A6ZS90_9PLEO|nr:Cloroperoxidase [Ophiobolus disseminans]